jgi:sugar O-acyltransferase (sialic acid O-acetyltransferase NeuD family)
MRSLVQPNPRTTRQAILYGVGSPYVVEIEEICRRLGIEVIAHVANIDGEVFASPPSRVVRLQELGDIARDIAAFIPMITPGYRYRAVCELDELGRRHRPMLADPHAVIASSATIEEGVTVNAAAVIAGAVIMERYAAVNRSASIGHHVHVEAYATIGPGAVIAGSARIGRGAFIGAGAVVLPKCSIGANAVVGAGAVVTRDVPANVLVAGHPARVIQAVAGYGDVGVP